jgi:hypothetical protein
MGSGLRRWVPSREGAAPDRIALLLESIHPGLHLDLTLPPESCSMPRGSERAGRWQCSKRWKRAPEEGLFKLVDAVTISKPAASDCLQ